MSHYRLNLINNDHEESMNYLYSYILAQKILFPIFRINIIQQKWSNIVIEIIIQL